MDLSRPPQVGAVISFCYLWRREFEAGLVEGSKARPCLAVAVEPERGQAPARPWVTVLPITRQPAGDRALPSVNTWLYGYIGRGLFATVRRDLADLLRGTQPLAPVDRGG